MLLDGFAADRTVPRSSCVYYVRRRNDSIDNYGHVYRWGGVTQTHLAGLLLSSIMKATGAIMNLIIASFVNHCLNILIVAFGIE